MLFRLLALAFSKIGARELVAIVEKSDSEASNSYASASGRALTSYTIFPRAADMRPLRADPIPIRPEISLLFIYLSFRSAPSGTVLSNEPSVRVLT